MRITIKLSSQMSSNQHEVHKCFNHHPVAVHSVFKLNHVQTANALKHFLLKRCFDICYCAILHFADPQMLIA